MDQSSLLVEVLKVRLQLANAAMTTSKSAIRAGLIETTRKTYQKEGVRAFYAGLMPAVIRGLFYGGVRLGTIAISEVTEKESAKICVKGTFRRVWTDQKPSQTFR